MIPELLRKGVIWVGAALLLALATPSLALAQDEGNEESDEEAPEDEDPLSRYRTPFGVLAERTIGTTSRPVEFNWRRTRLHLAGQANHLYELNNFDSLRAGAMARFPGNGLIYELGLSYVWVWDTLASERLALTPYRQPGRPERLEIDFNIGLPLAEGVVTAAPKWFPSAQLVFNAYAGVRYIVYPYGFRGMKIGGIAGALLSPSLTEKERENLDSWRKEAMQLDPGRYGIMVGIGNDIYFKQGLFISPRTMFALPLLAPASETELLFWADLSLAIGFAL